MSDPTRWNLDAMLSEDALFHGYGLVDVDGVSESIELAEQEGVSGEDAA